MANYGRSSSAPTLKKGHVVKSETFDVFKSRVVAGPVDSLEDFQAFLALVASEVGNFKSFFYRNDEKCGFVNFSDMELPLLAIKRFHNSEFHGHVLKVAYPHDYFENEEDARPNRKTSVEDASRGTSSTLLLMNLNTTTPFKKLASVLEARGVVPQHIGFKRDSSGNFQGTAFLKFANAEAAVAARQQLSGLEVDGNKVRVEFKRDKTTQGTSPHPHPPICTLTATVNSPTRPPIPPNVQPKIIDETTLRSNIQDLMDELQSFAQSRFVTEVTMPVSSRPEDRRAVQSLAEILGLNNNTFFTDESGAWFVTIQKPVAAGVRTGLRVTSEVVLSSRGDVPQNLPPRAPLLSSSNSHPTQLTRENKVKGPGVSESKGFRLVRTRGLSATSEEPPEHEQDD